MRVTRHLPLPPTRGLKAGDSHVIGSIAALALSLPQGSYYLIGTRTVPLSTLVSDTSHTSI